MTRAIFFEEDDARAVAFALQRSGFEAGVARQGFAGEDDDEDQPWSVSTDAPDTMLELAADEHDGWVEYDVPTVTRPPIDLPSQPRRHHRPGTQPE